MNKTLQGIIEREELLPEDVAKLNSALEKVRDHTDGLVMLMPQAIQNFIASVEIEPVLHEDRPDEFVIQVIFFRSSGAVDSVCVVQGSQTFSVTCLDKNIEKDTEKKFKDTVINYMRECSQFLDELADSLQNAADYA